MNSAKLVVHGVCSVPVPQGSTLLEALEASNKEAPYHCRAGHCGACSVKLLDGEVSYKVEPMASVKNGRILLCCSYPASNALVIESP